VSGILDKPTLHRTHYTKANEGSKSTSAAKGLQYSCHTRIAVMALVERVETLGFGAELESRYFVMVQIPDTRAKGNRASKNSVEELRRLQSEKGLPKEQGLGNLAVVGPERHIGMEIVVVET